MVVLIKKFTNFPIKSKPKMDHPESIALQYFNSNLSENLHKLFSGQKNGLNCGSVSLSWYIPCFKFIQGMNRAFANLVKDLDYPVAKWKADLVEDYLSYTLSMLDALNSITSSISHLGISRLSLSHAITLIPNHPSSAIQHLKPIIPKKNEKGFNFKEICEKGYGCGEEKVIYEALMKMRNVCMLIMKVLLTGLYCERNGDLSLISWDKMEGFDLGFVDNLMVIKEIEEVNEVVKKVEACLVSGHKCGAAAELKGTLGELEDLTQMVEKEVNCLFSELLATRNELIDCFRFTKCS